MLEKVRLAMVTTREIRGSKEQLKQQIEQVDGEILSAILVVDEPEQKSSFRSPSDEEFARLMNELESMAVDAPNADYSREAMYTRMPGE